MASHIERILILAKTYPSPSAKHVETSCVAGINDRGEPRRLYPIPFRMVSEEQQFKKWQWIQVRIEKSSADHRPESHRVFVDTIEPNECVSSEKMWAQRREWWQKLPTFDSFAALESQRQREGSSLALLRPKRVERLEIRPVDSADWTEEELAKLVQQQSQGNLFEPVEQRKQLKMLQKLPHDFYYHYVCDTDEGEQIFKHKIVDWEIGMLYRRCVRNYPAGWEAKFRQKLEVEFAHTDLMFMMGNMHRFPHQWLIISLFYPPKPEPLGPNQGSLF